MNVRKLFSGFIASLLLAILAAAPALAQQKPNILFIMGLAAPSTAYIYNWNMLPIGQLLWLKELESYVAFPPMQDPASYNLTQVLNQIKQQGHRHPSE